MPGSRAIIDGDKCRQEADCPPMENCPANAIINDEGFRYVDNSCRGCKKCVILCPYRAIIMVK
ncbi:4Fe-4S binding protein [Metallumcola ferriviriculae]|uniref:4Fe-4S binding protein n=1 Tax=Metallumcola ferriviriculae TaxID=3039180 RepID=A0AAU0UQ52_9FIRM|nr:4Fe-4S binding protein [Desulfitibacteraceae bacterium MK1]